MRRAGCGAPSGREWEQGDRRGAEGRVVGRSGGRGGGRILVSDVGDSHLPVGYRRYAMGAQISPARGAPECAHIHCNGRGWGIL